LIRFRPVSFAFGGRTKQRWTFGKVRYIPLLVGRNSLFVQLPVRPSSRDPNGRTHLEVARTVAYRVVNCHRGRSCGRRSYAVRIKYCCAVSRSSGDDTRTRIGTSVVGHNRRRLPTDAAKAIHSS